MQIGIIKYNAGNVRSVLFALERIGVQSVVTDDIDTIRSVDGIIFPGVGEASTAMAYLRERKLDEVICSLTHPVLGICLGMQLMCTSSEENNTSCLGIFSEKVKRFSDKDYKVPQIGWNTINHLQSPLFVDISENSYVYFVHGYYVGVCERTIATTNYVEPYSAALQKNNFFAVQFHPEKSSGCGQKIIENFVAICQ